MPVVRFKNQAFARVIEYEIFLRGPIVIGNDATSVHANARLTCFVMTVTAANGIVHTIDIKCPLHRKGNILLDNSKISPLVRMRR